MRKTASMSKVSTFIHVLDEDTIWNALSKEKIKLSKESIQYIKEHKNDCNIKDIPLEIKDNKDIITTIPNEKKLIDYWLEKTTDRQYQGLYLITTTSCNLNCDYCFYRSGVSESLLKRSNMSFAVCKKAIDKFKEITNHNKRDNEYWQQITFYGGEPSINKELLVEAIPYARKVFNNDYTSIVINTNLTIYDEELFKLYKDYDVEVQVSLDGNKNIHDIHRKTLGGEGSFDLVISNLKIIKGLGVKIVPMVTANDMNVNNFSDILYEIVKVTGAEDFGVNILITDSYKTDYEYPKKLALEMKKAYERFGNIANDSAYVSLKDGILGIDKNIVKNSCGSTRKITVFPDGRVFACQALEKLPNNIMGTLDDDFVNNSNWEYFKKRNRFSLEKCLKCELIGTCGGGCAQGAYNRYGDIYHEDYNQCEYAKEMFRLLNKHERKNSNKDC